MSRVEQLPLQIAAQGVQIGVSANPDRDALFEILHQAGVSQLVVATGNAREITVALKDGARASLVPGGSTFALASLLDLCPGDDAPALKKEILVALASAPQRIHFPSVQEFLSHLNMRCGIVRAAAKTQIAFDSEEASRPEEDWVYREGLGYTLLPGRSLVAALTKATQPGPQGRLYAYSCYRATEYVLLLGMAQEMERVHPDLLRQLESRWRRRPIASREFHDTFLLEYGSMDDPLPPEHFVPGDRVWFCNPDDASSDIAGYEGSWVIYLGGGRFSDFWKGGHSYTLMEKCVEIFHWRNGVRQSPHGEPVMDEGVVEQLVKRSIGDPAETAKIMERMCRLRSKPGDPRSEGGCLDGSREFPRSVCPGTHTIVLPGIAGD